MKKSLKVSLSLSAVALVAVACFIYVLAQRTRTARPQTHQTRTAGGSTQIVVPVGGDLQAAVDSARLGDTVILQAGATYKGPLVLSNKGNGSGTDADYITIRTSDTSGIPTEGERVKPELHARSMARIVSPSQQSAVSTAERTHHFKFIGIEFAPASDASYVHNVIDLGRSDYTSASQSPHHLVFDRCYVHSTGLNKARRGFGLNSAETSIINSWVAGFAGAGDETQAIAGWNGPGPFHIINNYLEAGAEIVLFGGADPSIPNLVPSDIEVRRNHLYRPAEWAGKATVKGNFELKNARRVVVDGNVIDGGIRETAFVLTVRNQDGKAPWSTIEDVEITNNIVRSASTGVNILGSDHYHPSQTAKRIRIANNLFTDLVSPGDIAYFLQINGGEDITVEHNTVQQAGNIISSEKPSLRFVFRNNIVQYNAYGMACFVQGPPCPDNMACHCFPGAAMKGNVIADNANIGSNYPIAKNFPIGNLFVTSYEKLGFIDHVNGNWRLAANSKFRRKATDDTDPGIDFASFEASGVERVARVSGTRQ